MDTPIYDVQRLFEQVELCVGGQLCMTELMKKMKKEAKK
jgi:hypothetical protein